MPQFSKTHFAFALFLLTSFVWRPLNAGAATPVIERAKLATALVELPDEEGFGSAFCITPEGIFVTNQHVVEGVAVGGKVKLVLNAGERNQRIVDATVLRVNEQDDLALLRADSRVPFTALSLGDTANLTETQPVAAIGFPFGADLALEEGQYPNAAVNIGRITALRKVQGELHELQIDAAINPGNSGGPLINERGQVIGVVYAGIRDAQAVNFAISVGLLNKMLKAPVIVFQPPAKLPTNKHQESEFSIKLLPILNAPTPFSVSLTLSAGKGDNRTFLAQNQGNNQYLARAALLPAGLAQSNLISFAVSVRQGAETVAESKGVIELNVAAPTAGGTGWLGGAAAPGANAGGANAPKPEDSNQLVLQGTQAIDDLRVSAFTFPTNEIVSNMLWSGDGKKLFLLNKSGMLRRIAVPEFKEEKTLNLAQTCSALALSQLGLVVGLPQIHQVWLIDANTFAVLKRIPAAGVDSLASAPALTTAYATNKEMLTIIDLAEGKAAAQLSPRAASRLTAGPLKKSPDATPLFNFRLPAVTPDGKYFFCVGDESYHDVFGSLHRFRINQNTLIYEEVGPTIGKNPQRIEVSDDSSYVSMPSGGGNTDRGYTTHVYAVGDLTKPVVSLESGAYPRALGFDRIGGRIYAQDFGNQLIVFTPTGLREKSYKVANGQDAETNQFLASPLGHRVLVSTGAQLLWVELPGAGESRRPVTAVATPPTASLPKPNAAPNFGGGFGGPPKFGGATNPGVAGTTPNSPFGGRTTPAPAAAAVPIAAGALEIEIQIEGKVTLNFQDDMFWIENQSGKAPETVTVNGKAWPVEWDGKTSKKIAALNPPIPHSDRLRMKLKSDVAAGSAFLFLVPRAPNHFSAKAGLDRERGNGTGLYKLSLSWDAIP